jgi:hypothetical protein
MNGKVFNKLNLTGPKLSGNPCMLLTSAIVTKRETYEECGFDESQLAIIPINQGEKVSCENFAEVERDDEFFRFCFMNDTTTIEAMDATISTIRDVFINGLWFNSNKNIFYLPIHVVKELPNLGALHADDCNIKQISNANFKGLSKLRRLSLEHNQIQTVLIGTFDNSTSLEFISLGKKVFFLFTIQQKENDEHFYNASAGSSDMFRIRKFSQPLSKNLTAKLCAKYKKPKISLKTSNITNTSFKKLTAKGFKKKTIKRTEKNPSNCFVFLKITQ